MKSVKTVIIPVIAVLCVLFVIFLLFMLYVSDKSKTDNLWFPESNISSYISVPESQRVDLNNADYAEIADIPDLGLELAQEIVHYREVNGSFTSVGQLKNVAGISEEIYLRVYNYFYVDENTASENEISYSGEKININTATYIELTAIPTIGEATAKRIIIYREQNGDFISVNELLEIEGIGEKTFDKIKPYITV